MYWLAPVVLMPWSGRGGFADPQASRQHASTENPREIKGPCETTLPRASAAAGPHGIESLHGRRVEASISRGRGSAGAYDGAAIETEPGEKVELLELGCEKGDESLPK